MKVSVSILSSSIKPNEIIVKADKTNADYIHLDIMDGKFVENKTWTMSEVLKLSSLTTKKFDVHLMVNNPSKYINDYAMINTEYLTFHYEAVKNPLKVIEEIEMVGLKPGISIKPDTNVSEITSLLPRLKQILVMSVEPGKSGQSFMESVLYKIEVLKRIIDENGYDCIINVDGGINDETVSKVCDAGVDMVVSASFLHGYKNMQEGIDILRS